MTATADQHAEHHQPTTVSPVLAVLPWLWVVVPFAYGLEQLLMKIPALFG
ncbi:MFS transporter small subunit [Pseudonocardia phyllosphaerae]